MLLTFFQLMLLLKTAAGAEPTQCPKRSPTTMGPISDCDYPAMVNDACFTRSPRRMLLNMKAREHRFFMPDRPRNFDGVCRYNRRKQACFCKEAKSAQDKADLQQALQEKENLKKTIFNQQSISENRDKLFGVCDETPMAQDGGTCYYVGATLLLSKLKFIYDKLDQTTKHFLLASRKQYSGGVIQQNTKSTHTAMYHIRDIAEKAKTCMVIPAEINTIYRRLNEERRGKGRALVVDAAGGSSSITSGRGSPPVQPLNVKTGGYATHLLEAILEHNGIKVYRYEWTGPQFDSVLEKLHSNCQVLLFTMNLRAKQYRPNQEVEIEKVKDSYVRKLESDDFNRVYHGQEDQPKVSRPFQGGLIHVHEPGAKSGHVFQFTMCAGKMILCNWGKCGSWDVIKEQLKGWWIKEITLIFEPVHNPSTLTRVNRHAMHIEGLDDLIKKFNAKEVPQWITDLNDKIKKQNEGIEGAGVVHAFLPLNVQTEYCSNVRNTISDMDKLKEQNARQREDIKGLEGIASAAQVILSSSYHQATEERKQLCDEMWEAMMDIFERMNERGAVNQILNLDRESQNVKIHLEKVKLLVERSEFQRFPMKGGMFRLPPREIEDKISRFNLDELQSLFKSRKREAADATNAADVAEKYVEALDFAEQILWKVDSEPGQRRTTFDKSEAWTNYANSFNFLIGGNSGYNIPKTLCLKEALEIRIASKSASAKEIAESKYRFAEGILECAKLRPFYRYLKPFNFGGFVFPVKPEVLKKEAQKLFKEAYPHLEHLELKSYDVEKFQ